MKTKAYSYVRFSSAKQRKGDSLRRQTEKTFAYCNANNLELDYSLKLQDLNVSSFRGKNVTEGKLGVFLQAVKDGVVPKGSVLIVENLDRLTRTDVLSAQQLFVGILRSGIEIVTLMDSRRYSEASVISNPMDLMASILVMMRAHEESQTKSIRTNSAMDKAIAKAVETGKPINGVCPRWLRLNKETKSFEPIPERVAIIKKIFAMANSGLGYSRIIRKLNEEKIPSIFRTEWAMDNIRDLLFSKTLLGILTIKGTTIPKYYPAVLSEAEFYQTKNIIAERTHGNFGKRDKHVRNIFGKVLVNGFDNRQMILRHNGQALRMISAGIIDGGKNWRSFNYDLFEAVFLRWVGEVSIQNIQTIDRSSEIKGRLAEIEMRLAKITKALKGENFDDALIEVSQSLSSQRRTLKAELEKELGKETRHAKPSEVKNLVQQLATTADMDKRDGLRLQIRDNIQRLVKKITVYPFSQGGAKPRLLVATVELADDTVRLFTIKAQTHKQAVSMGSDPIGFDKGISHFPKFIESFFKRNALDGLDGNVMDKIVQSMGLPIKIFTVGTTADPIKVPASRNPRSPIETAIIQGAKAQKSKPIKSKKK